tara:strand:- start:1248 stop:2132 length:885 start_codon:yes stop_codon:yes gene_type:complete
MTLVLPSDYHAINALERSSVRWIPVEKAERQDIRPLRIGILNIMPIGEKYEFNIIHPLGLSVLQIEPIWIKLESHKYKTWAPGHLDELYKTYEDTIKDSHLDGLIVTGAPVEHLRFEEVEYWEEFKDIVSDSRKNTPSTLGICWGGFALGYISGIKKLNFEKKLFGLYELDNLDPGHEIMNALDDKFLCPQSRFAGMNDEELNEASESKDINILATGKESGHTIFETSDHKLLMHIGHPEYAASRFAEEAIRDKDNPNVPNVENFDYNNPINSWRMHRNIFFQQWINFCYKSIS